MRRFAFIMVGLVILALATPSLTACVNGSRAQETIGTRSDKSYYQVMSDGYRMLCIWGGEGNGGPTCDWVGYHIHLGDLPGAQK